MFQDEDHSPSWLDAENDESHRTEIAPLFGTGNLSLIDTEEQQRVQKTISDRMRYAAQQALMTTTKTSSKYGSLLDHEEEEGAVSSTQQNDDDDDDYNNDEENGHSDSGGGGGGEEESDDDVERRNATTTTTTAQSVITSASASTTATGGGSKASRSSSSSWVANSEKVPLLSWLKKKKKKKNVSSSSKTTQENYDLEDQQEQEQPIAVTILASGKPEMPHRNCFIGMFFFIEGFGIITSLCLITTQILPFVIYGKVWQDLGIVSLLLKIYLSCFCVLFILVESEFLEIRFIKSSTFLQTYISRGFLYSFIGLTCMQEAYSERITDMVKNSETVAEQMFHVSWISLFMQVSSWMMVGLGIVYMILGICCFQRIRNRMVKRYREEWKSYKVAMKRYKREMGE